MRRLRHKEVERNTHKCQEQPLFYYKLTHLCFFIGNTFGITMTSDVLRNKHSDIFILCCSSSNSSSKSFIS